MFVFNGFEDLQPSTIIGGNFRPVRKNDLGITWIDFNKQRYCSLIEWGPDHDEAQLSYAILNCGHLNVCFPWELTELFHRIYFVISSS